MAEQIKYKLTFPKTQIRITNPELDFMIGNIKSRQISVAYFKFYGFDYHNNQIVDYTSERFMVTTSYRRVDNVFNLKDLFYEDERYSDERKYTVADLDNYFIEMYLIGIDSENPLYMNHLMLCEYDGDDEKEWHSTNEEKEEVEVGFSQNCYANLYNNDDTFLQLIVPNKERMTTTKILPSQNVILVPHIPNESTWDNPINIFYEYMYQIEQRIGVEK